MSTTITITLPTDLEQIISTKAAADGKRLEEYALFVLRKDAELPDLRDLFADVRAEIAAKGVCEARRVFEGDGEPGDIGTTRPRTEQSND